MNIKTLDEWFDDLPENVKDALSELVYERDLDIIEQNMNNFIADSIRQTFKLDEKPVRFTKKTTIKADPELVQLGRDKLKKDLKKKHKKMSKTPITDNDIAHIRQKLDNGFDILPF